MKLLELLTGKLPITMKLPEWLTGKRSAKTQLKDFIGELEVHLRKVEKLLAELVRHRLKLEGDGQWDYVVRWSQFLNHMREFLEFQIRFERYRMFLRRFHFGDEQADIETMTLHETETTNLESCQRYLGGCKREWELFCREFSGVDLTGDRFIFNYFRYLQTMEDFILDMQLWDREFRAEQRFLEDLQNEIENYQRKREQLLVLYEEKKREYEALMRGIDEVEDVFHGGIDEVADVFHDAEAEF